MALLTSHLRFATDRYWVGLRLKGKAAASVVVLAGVVYLGLQGWRRGTEYVWLARAEGKPAFSDEQIACLKKAFAKEPMNPQTAYAIGEAYRVQSAVGGADYTVLAEQAMEWFRHSMKLNEWEGKVYAGCGWCLDWLGRPAESARYFERAVQLEPNSYFMMDNIGRHYVQTGDFAAAKPWFERSLSLHGDNAIAQSYLNIVIRRMQEAATNEMSARLNFPSQ